jgi:cephalosporin hydroxylase
MRSFRTAFAGPMLDSYQKGVMAYTYKGVPCLKSPIDLAIYMQLLWDLRPQTVIEIGSHSGGSALFFADILRSYGCDNTSVVSIDLKSPEGVQDSRIRFFEGSVLDLERVFEVEDLSSLPHPWFVTEDSAHSYEGCMAALKFFSKLMLTGDVLAIEDGVLEDLGLSSKYDGGPNRAIAEFLTTDPDSFEVATDMCDLFGFNATYNPNGYLRKLGPPKNAKL